MSTDNPRATDCSASPVRRSDIAMHLIRSCTSSWIAFAWILFVASLFTLSTYPTPRAEASVPLVGRSQDLTVVSEETRARINETYGRLPLSFEPNRGQADPQTRFLAHGSGYTVLLT